MASTKLVVGVKAFHMGFHESHHELLVARVASALIVSSVAENHDSDKVSRTILIAIKLGISWLNRLYPIVSRDC